MHDADIASRKETVMKGRWKRLNTSKARRKKTNETAVVSRERKQENQKSARYVGNAASLHPSLCARQ
jgi:hypothetical protein